MLANYRASVRSGSWRSIGIAGAAVFVILFLVPALYMAEVGRVMWTDSHNPRASAHIDSRRCWTSDGGDGGNENLCDLVVSYTADHQPVTTRMKAVDESGIVGDQIRVSYSPGNVTDASGPENNSAIAFVAWGAAVGLIAMGVWLQVLNGRRREAERAASAVP